MKQYPAVLRERLLRFLDAGHSQAEAARTFGVSLRSISRWRAQQAATGDLAPRRSRPQGPAGPDAAHRSDPGGPPGSAGGGHPRCHVGRARPDLGAAARRHAERGDDGADPPPARHHAQKKVLRASERDEAQRAAWRQAVAQLDPATLIFVDETGTNLSLTRRYGRAKRGERVVDQVPRNPGPNVTLIAALDQEGLLGELTMTGATDGDAFEAYVTRVLVPKLWPGDVVIWDNLSAHKRKRARIWVESAGAQVLFLPPYSPDFNPIELAFSKVKAALRGAGARTRTELDQAITAALLTITSHDAQGWFTHCGYTKARQLF